MKGSRKKLNQKTFDSNSPFFPFPLHNTNSSNEVNTNWLINTWILNYSWLTRSKLYVAYSPYLTVTPLPPLPHSRPLLPSPFLTCQNKHSSSLNLLSNMLPFMDRSSVPYVVLQPRSLNSRKPIVLLNRRFKPTRKNSNTLILLDYSCNNSLLSSVTSKLSLLLELLLDRKRNPLP